MAGWDPSSPLVGLLLLFHTWGGVWADVVVNMEDRMEVYRRDTAHITCMFESSEGIGGVIIQWLYVTRTGEKQTIFYQDPTMKNVEKGTRFTNRITVNGTGAIGVVVLTINDVELEDEVEFICLIKMPTELEGEGRTRLKVFEKPDPPSIEALLTGILVSDAGPSTVATCEVKNGYPKPNVTWYRNRAPLRNDQDVVRIVLTTTMESSGLYSIKSELSLKVVKEDNDAEFYCEVDFLVPGETRMMESERINITVYYPSTEVDIWVESPKGNIKVGDTVELHCQGNGNNPADLISIKHATTEQTWAKDKVLLENVTLGNGGVYICLYTDMESFLDITGQTEVHVNFLHPAEVIPRETVVVEGQKVMATCNASSSLQTHTAWFKDGKELSTNHTLLLEDATFDTAGTYECRIWVPDMEGLTTKGTLLVKVHGAPQITKPDNTDIEESFENTVDLSCDVRGLPAPAVTWTTSDGKVLNTATQSVTEEGVQSVVRVEVTSDITAFCNASNDYGSDALAFNIRAIISTTTAATTTTTTASTSISPSTVKAETAIPPKKLKKEGNGVIIAVIIISILLLAILGSVLFFLYKKGKICGRSGKQYLTKEKSSKDNIVVEMKSDNTEEAVLLGINGEKQPQSNQGGEYLDVQE